MILQFFFLCLNIVLFFGLKKGLGKGVVSSGSGENRDAYLQLSVSVLSAFCRVSEIASSKEMVSKVPMIFEVMSMK